MANAFDVDQAQQKIPIEIIAGDLVIWRRDDLIDLYPTADYAVSYSFQCLEHPSGQHHNFAVTGQEDSKGYYFQLTGSTTLGLNHLGDYSYQVYVTRTSDSARITVDSGTIKVTTDLASQNEETRIHAEIMVQKIQTLLEGKPDTDVASYSIQGRSLTKMSYNELIQAREYYRREVVKHRNEEKIKSGRKTANTVKVRFV